MARKTTKNKGSFSPEKKRKNAQKNKEILAATLHSVALRFPGFGGVSQENRESNPSKGRVAPTFA